MNSLDNSMALLAFIVVLFLVLGVGAWIADRITERERRHIKVAPRREAVVRHRLYW